VTGWRERLARLRDGATAAKTARTAKSPDGWACQPPFGTNGSFGSGGRDANGSAEPGAERPARALGGEVLRWLGRGAAVEALGGGYRLTLPDGRSLTITAEGAATLDDGLRGDLAERVAIATEHLARPRSWASLDPPPQGAWCLACRGGRFWREREAPRGWRCALCHPPDHLSAAAVATAP